jgi:hypothetical protein
MKRKHLFLAVAAVLAAGGLWFARSAWRTQAFHTSSMGVGTVHQVQSDDINAQPARSQSASEMSHGTPKPGQMLRPPDPTRRFTDFTPEQRVQFAREGHGPGG